MVEALIDKSFTCGILMSQVEKIAWDTLTVAWNVGKDDCSLNNLRFSWDNH
jgi:hypothetical protein